MTSDEERREVARRLRETGEELGSAALLWYHIAKALGVRTATDGKTACDMLADLIEPSYSATTPHYSADRDALLGLADEMDKCAWYFSLEHDEDELRDRLEEASDDFADASKAIRKAVGA